MEIILNLNKMIKFWLKIILQILTCAPHPSWISFLCENPFFQLHETQYWWEYKKTFQNIKNEISSECWENWIFCFIDLKVSESPIMLLLVPNWRAYLALWLVNSLSFISTTKVTLMRTEQANKSNYQTKLAKSMKGKISW